MDEKPKIDRSKDLQIWAVILVCFLAFVAFEITRGKAEQQDKDKQDAYARQGDEQLRKMRENVAKYQGQTDAERQADFDREQQDNQQ